VNILAVIPAKGESTRLPGKNMRQIAGKTLIEIAVEYAKSSQIVTDIVVSTDSNAIKEFVESNGLCECIMRNKSLAGEADVTEVYYHAWQSKEQIANYVVGIQPDHPNRNLNIDDVLNYVFAKKLDDLITVDESGQKNGSLRILRCPFNSLWHVGSLRDNCVNIHTEEDLEKTIAAVE